MCATRYCSSIGSMIGSNTSRISYVVEMKRLKSLVFRKSKRAQHILVVACLFAELTLQCPCDCSLHTADCSARNLTSLPSLAFASLSVINVSFNHLSSFPSDGQPLPVHRVLDLSYNLISKFPASVFAASSFLDLKVLNLTGNLIAGLTFALPTSLKVLKLSKNKLQEFSLTAVQNMTELQTLHISHNNISTLISIVQDKDVPKGCPFEPFLQLVELSLQGNRLTKLDVHIFECFHQAVYISLADNHIDSIPAKLFSSFRQLRFLDLSGNSLTFIPAGTFSKMSSMKYFSLANNHLERVPVNLPMMEWLDLSNNSITTVAEEQKSDLYPQEVFLIGRNPLHCDCALLWLKELFDSRKYLLKYMQVDRDIFVPSCSTPVYLGGNAWDLLSGEAFSCKVKGDDSGDKSSGQAGEMQTHLENLSVRVSDVGCAHVSIEWDPLNNMEVDKSSEASLETKGFISYHQFGRTTQFSVAVHLITGSYTLGGLRPSTAYIICMSLRDPLLRSRHVKGDGEECIEITTRSKERMHTSLTDGLVVAFVISLLFGLLLISCCCIKPNIYWKGKKE